MGNHLLNSNLRIVLKMAVDVGEFFQRSTVPQISTPVVSKRFFFFFLTYLILQNPKIIIGIQIQGTYKR